MNLTRRGLVAATAMLPAAAGAQDARARLNALKPAGFPREPIEMTVVYPAGGGMDITARVVQRFFEKATGERSLVNNRTGGAGLVGHTWLATQAPADGHAVGIVANLIFSDAVRSQGRWSWTDLDHIAHINAEPLNLVVNAEGPFRQGGLPAILEAARARPGTIRALNVPGGYYEYLIEQLEAAAGARFLRVPFQGGAPGITALLGNNIDLGFGFFAEVRGHLAANRLLPIAVTGRTRTVFLPDTPTVNNVTGRDDVNWGVSRWVAIPKAVPADRKAWLAAAFHAAINDPEAAAEFRNLGALPDPALNTPEALQADVVRMAQAERDFLIASGRAQR
ncbi:MAG: tripartite tricarboxylate transporter substrate binding protein [Rhodospirillales bacterium]|jgi:tripartite-type tricarboxylate transporter receptor subunit TctC|nr:tripartite tricarboxylate transporter substrate binding protein [Rhodospirillales bacterium]